MRLVGFAQTGSSWKVNRALELHHTALSQPPAIVWRSDLPGNAGERAPTGQCLWGDVARRRDVWHLALGTSSWAAEPYSDWITVDRVLVNKLGGVNVSGEVSCEGTYEDLMAGRFRAVDENEQWYAVVPPGAEDRVNIFVNADQYTVSQPAGRRMMIQVEHGSSRMTPCYAQ